MSVCEAVGARIRGRRMARKMSLAALSDRTGIDYTILSRVERGIVETTLDRYGLIAAALDVPLSSLFRRKAA